MSVKASLIGLDSPLVPSLCRVVARIHDATTYGHLDTLYDATPAAPLQCFFKVHSDLASHRSSSTTLHHIFHATDIRISAYLTMPSSDISNRRCFVMQGRTSSINTGKSVEAGSSSNTDVAASLESYFHTTESRSHAQAVLEGSAACEGDGYVPRNLLKPARYVRQDAGRSSAECEAEDEDEEADIRVAEVKRVATPVAKVVKDAATGEVRAVRL